MLVRKVREERAKEQTEGRKMCDCEPFFCVSKCGVEQTRAEETGREHEVDGRFYRKTRREKKKDGSDKVNCLSRLGGSRVCFRVVPK